MGRQAIFDAATSYFENADIPMVGTVFPGRPIVVDEEDYDLQMSQGLFEDVSSIDGSSAVLIVNIPTGHRQRQTITGRAFEDDSYIHNMVLELFFANVSGDGVAAQRDHNAVCDAIVAAIRADPLLGQPPVVWSAGEFKPVDVEQREPFTNSDGLVIFIPAVIRFDVYEWLTGQGV